LLLHLNRLRDDHRACLPGELRQGADHGAADPVEVDVPNQGDVQLDDVGLHVDDVAHAGEAGTRIVDADQNPGGAEWGESGGERGVIKNLGVLGDLQNDPSRFDRL